MTGYGNPHLHRAWISPWYWLLTTLQFILASNSWLNLVTPLYQQATYEWVHMKKTKKEHLIFGTYSISLKWYWKRMQGNRYSCLHVSLHYPPPNPPICLSPLSFKFLASYFFIAMSVFIYTHKHTHTHTNIVCWVYTLLVCMFWGWPFVQVFIKSQFIPYK